MTLTTFSDEQFARKRITGFEIRGGDVIDAIRVKYGNTWGEWHGGNGGKLHKVDLGGSLVKTFKIVKGSYYGLKTVGQITITTQDEKTHGPYGKTDLLKYRAETTYSVPNGKGFISGHHGDLLEDLSFLMEEDDDDDEDSDETTEDEDEELRNLLDNWKCKVCDERPATEAFLYCGHLASCEDCSENLFVKSKYEEPKCPVCKKQVSNTLKINFW